MKQPLYGVVPFTLFLFSVLCSLATAADVSGFCNKLLNEPDGEFFIWAIGFSGNYFYVLGSDYTGVELPKNQVVISETKWTINLASGNLKTINCTSHNSFPNTDYYGIIGYYCDKSFVMIRHQNCENRDTFSFIDLDEPAPTEKEYRPPDVKTCFGGSYFYNSEQSGKFYVHEDHGDIVKGSFTGNRANPGMKTDNPVDVIGTIHGLCECPFRTGFLRGDFLYVVSNSEKKVHKFKMGRCPSHDPMESKPFHEVFICDSKGPARPTSSSHNPDSSKWPDSSKPGVLVSSSRSPNYYDRQAEERKMLMHKILIPIYAVVGVLLVSAVIFMAIKKTKSKNKLKSGSAQQKKKAHGHAKRPLTTTTGTKTKTQTAKTSASGKTDSQNTRPKDSTATKTGQGLRAPNHKNTKTSAPRTSRRRAKPKAGKKALKP